MENRGEIKGAKGYQIQYATNKGFKKAKIVKVSGKASSKSIKKLTGGKTYYFRVRAFKKAGGKTVYTKWSSAKKARITFFQTKIRSLRSDERSITVKWKKVSGANGYSLQYSKKKNMEKASTIKIGSQKTIARRIKGLDSDTKYYVRVRAKPSVRPGCRAA